jgi:hypothetical protein
LQFNFNLVAGDPTNLVRIFIFKWRPDSTSDTPTGGEVFQDVSSTTGALNSPPYATKPNRAKILYDNLFPLDTVKNIQQIRKVTLKFNINCSFQTSVNTGVDHLFLGWVSDSAVTPHPTIAYSTILYFTDS